MIPIPKATKAARSRVVGRGSGSIDAARQLVGGLMMQARKRLEEGEPVRAEQICREILDAFPDYPDALNFLSVALGQQGRAVEAERCSRAALAIRPGDPCLLQNLGNRLQERGETGQAIAAWRQALERELCNPTLISKLARALAEAGRPEEAAEVARAIALCPEPRDSRILIQCASVLAVAGRPCDAVPLFEEALPAAPDDTAWWLDYARLGLRLERFEAAEPALQKVIECDPGHAEARIMLAALRWRRHDYAGMEAVLSGLTASGMDAANALNLTGLMLVARGKLEEGLKAHAMLEQLAPHASTLQMTRIMYLNYDPAISRDALFQQHRTFGERFAGATPPLPAPDGGRDPERKLKIGYLSPDLRRHSVAFFMLPIFEAFDRERFEVHGYAEVAHPDDVTELLRSFANGWRDVTGQDDTRLAQQIRADGIDILVDLAGYTKGSRLLALTAKPAPIQMTYLGYPNTTGLPQVDYRITDHVADSDDADAFHTETLIRLPRCFLCYAPPGQGPEIAPLPFERNGFITFGSFNNLSKLNRGVVATWAEVVRAVPGARLLLKATASADPETQRQLHGMFADAGLAPERVNFAPYAGRTSEHLAQYNEVDIALDPFPYNGATTTCEALWMGVPVITLAGDRHAGRVGASLLRAIGFEAGITRSRDDYVMTARLLAEHPELLAAARRHLRADLVRSPLCDRSGFTAALEEAYREVWRMWCADETPSERIE